MSQPQRSLLSLLPASFALTLLPWATGGASQAIPAPAPPPLAPNDPAVLRGRLLERLDAAIDAAATKAHLDARLAIEAIMPVPYLGLDATPVAQGMKVDHVYPDTGAEASGLRVGDVLTRIDDDVTDSKAAMARSVRRHRVGDVARLSILRAGSTAVLEAPIGKRPEEDEDEEEQFPDLPKIPATTDTISLDFEAERGGSLPAVLESVLGGHGRHGNWLTIQDGSRSFLRQTDADSTGIRFPMVVLKGFDAPDVSASVRFRFFAGKIDRAAGIVLRYRDSGNYLVARANAAEADLRIFRVVNGLRRTLPGAIVACPTGDDQWHTLEFRCEGARLTATVDGKATTSSYDTFFLRGSAGLWTKSDSQTEFDDARFEPLAPSRGAAPK